jgi:exocyst complex component 5
LELYHLFPRLIQFTIGEQLESVHHHRERAKAAYDLVDYYNQFSRDDTSRLEALRKEGKEGRRQVAVILRRLGTVSKEVDLPHSEKVKEFWKLVFSFI